jgi:uncharacterized membrane protein
MARQERRQSESGRNLPAPTERNVRTIADIEREFLARRTAAERLGDAVARFSGSMTFVVLNAVWYLVWIVVNAGLVPGIKPFDPYPYTFLTLMVSLEAIFLAIFVLASQNRMSRVAEQRANLDLQINMLAEEESTHTLRLLSAIARRLGLETEAQDDEAQQLARPTDAKTLLQELEERLSTD